MQGGETLYSYVHNPVGFIDPFGLAVCPTLTRDALGRITHAEATITKGIKGTGVNKSAKEHMKKHMGALADDDAGHILAKILGGQGGKSNIFPQLKGINRGRYRIFEKQIREKLNKSDSPLDLKWIFKYDGLGKRPTGVQYDVYQDGKKVLESFFENI